MFVEPTRVRASRRRAMVLTGLALASVAALSVGSWIIAPHDVRSDRDAARLSAVAPASPSSIAASTPRTGGPSVPLAARQAELRVQVAAAPPSPGVQEQLEVDGWIPSQFAWVAIDVMAAGVPVASAGRQRSADGTFSATLFVPTARTTSGLLVRLSGVTEVQLSAVPLATVPVTDSRPVTWPAEMRTVIPR